jgi:hypothetical protein
LQNEPGVETASWFRLLVSGSSSCVVQIKAGLYNLQEKRRFLPEMRKKLVLTGYTLHGVRSSLANAENDPPGTTP